MTAGAQWPSGLSSLLKFRLNIPLCQCHSEETIRAVGPFSVFCPDFQKGRVPSEKGTLNSAVNGPSKGHFSVVNGPSKGNFSAVN